ncbi:hypothetical protein AR687_18140 [Flavobacteriaceae bacterium CRH]|nr:hypothetical protein AR687_18140 [Flavobacteriaceae bacterium CRH]
MARFELENYRNVLLIDNLILLTNTFYQSPEDFKYRQTNSKNDELYKMNDILELEFHSIGSILFLKLEKKTLKLEFYSNQRMNAFLKLILSDNFKLSKLENLDLKKSLLPVIIPILIFFSIIFITAEKFELNDFLKYSLLGIGFIIGIIKIVKEQLKATSQCIKKLEIEIECFPLLKKASEKYGAFFVDLDLLKLD